MHGANVGHHTDLRQGDIAQKGNFTRNVEPHFKDSPLVAGTQLQDGKWQSDFVVQIARAFKCVVTLAEHLSDHFFCSGFAYAACNSNHTDVQLATPEAGDLLQGGDCVIHAQA